MIIMKTKYIKQALLFAILSALLFVAGCGNSAVSSVSPEPENPAQEVAESSEMTEPPEQAPEQTSEKTPEQTPEQTPEKTPEQTENTEAAGDSAGAGGEGVTMQPNERIGFITQEYYGDNIVEIPYFEYEGEMNPEIESINRLLNQGLQFSYEDFLEKKEEQQWIEIKSYPFSTDDYLQVVITKSIYPNYGTDGDIESINYDRNTRKWLSVEDALELMGLTEGEVMTGVGENFDPEIAGGTLDSLKIAGFLIRDIPGDGRIELLLNVTVYNPEADDNWQGFYTYLPDDNPYTNDLTQLNSYCLFDPYSMDEMDPPLFYQKGRS